MLRRTAAALAAGLVMLITSSAEARVPNNTFPPPARYDHAFKGKIYIVYGGRWTLAARCGPMAWACSPVGGEAPGRCTMTLPAIGTFFLEGRVDAAGLRVLYRHERAHCNGWPANHPR